MEWFMLSAYLFGVLVAAYGVNEFGLVGLLLSPVSFVYGSYGYATIGLDILDRLNA